MLWGVGVSTSQLPLYILYNVTIRDLVRAREGIVKNNESQRRRCA